MTTACQHEWEEKGTLTNTFFFKKEIVAYQYICKKCLETKRVNV